MTSSRVSSLTVDEARLPPPARLVARAGVTSGELLLDETEEEVRPRVVVPAAAAAAAAAAVAAFAAAAFAAAAATASRDSTRSVIGDEELRP